MIATSGAAYPRPGRARQLPRPREHCLIADVHGTPCRHELTAGRGIGPTPARIRSRAGAQAPRQGHWQLIS